MIVVQKSRKRLRFLFRIRIPKISSGEYSLPKTQSSGIVASFQLGLLMNLKSTLSPRTAITSHSSPNLWSLSEWSQVNLLPGPIPSFKEDKVCEVGINAVAICDSVY